MYTVEKSGEWEIHAALLRWGFFVLCTGIFFKPKACDKLILEFQRHIFIISNQTNSTFTGCVRCGGVSFS